MKENETKPKGGDVQGSGKPVTTNPCSESTDHIKIEKERGRPFSAAVVGGDARQVAVAKHLAVQGCLVSLVGMGNVGVLPVGVRSCSSLRRSVEEGATRIVLPLPATRDGETVWCPMDLDHHVTLSDVAALMVPGMRLYGGRLPGDFMAGLHARGLDAVDYYEDETLQIQNAYMTAEGAVMTAMELTDRTIRGAQIAVVGYGRIGKMLSRMLVSLGADVTVYARRRDSLAWGESDGCKTALLPEAVLSLCRGYDVIFNTVPARIVGQNEWRQMPRSTLWIELASAPGGVDPEAARAAAEQTGLRVVWAPSLPGRYAPTSAGTYIARWILAQNEMGGG